MDMARSSFRTRRLHPPRRLPLPLRRSRRHRRPHASGLPPTGLIGLLDPDVTATGDSGGLATTVRRPVEDAEQLARGLVDLAGRLANLTILERTVNGQPGLVAQQDGVIVTVYAFDIAGDRITHIWAVRNPEKLQPWTAGHTISGSS
jgi:hypothetical protein